jgi:hypothetical protein
MRRKILRPVLLFTVLLSAVSCNLPSGPGYGEGTLTLLLPKTANRQTVGLRNGVAGVSRSVLSDTFTGGLVYRLTFTGPGETRTLDAGGGGTTVSLEAGVWNVAAEAYTDTAHTTKAGEGSAEITIIAGQNSSVRIPMRVDPAYESLLTEIYIHTEADLRRVAAGDFALDGSVDFYLERDIVLTQPWTPVGNGDAPFEALFDGQGHSVTVNSFSGPILEDIEYNAKFLGFFGMTGGAEIKNTAIRYNLAGTVDISGEGDTYSDQRAGGVAGFARNTTFENIQVSGSFSILGDGDDSFSVGGIAGYAEDVTITNCHVQGVISGETVNEISVGGIVGDVIASQPDPEYSITGSSFTGTVSSTSGGTSAIGGIVGYLDDYEITACYAEGHIEAEGCNPHVGGIAGEMDSYTDGIIKNCYAAGIIKGTSTDPVTGYSMSGGIAGYSIGSTNTIENCYAWADVTAESTGAGLSYAGGIEGGISSSSITKCYSRGTVDANDAGSVGGYAGGIAGDNNGGTIEYCAALNDSIVGATDQRGVAGKDASGTYGNNYTANELTNAPSNLPTITVNNDQNGLTGSYAYALFTEEHFTTSPQIYSSAYLDWNFTAGTGDWKWLSGYDYPVLQWQTSPPTGGPLPPE